eukprot:31018-Pelagococcus_subviridis.AAC.4
MSGLNRNAAGATISSNAASAAASPDPGGSGMFIDAPAPSPSPTSESFPVPGYDPSSCVDTNNTSGSSRKMSFVPFPWCTSKSNINTRWSPCALCACRAAAETVPKRQKPIAARGVAWCPGGRHSPNPVAASPPFSGPPSSPARAFADATTASTSAMAAPQPRIAASYDPGVTYVGAVSTSHGARVFARMSSPCTKFFV